MGDLPVIGASGKFAKPSKGGSPSHGHGLGGFLSNLGTDIVDTAGGIPGGITQMVEHPIRSAETMGKATWHDWSPLVHGHVGQWAHNTYAHPLAPLLDVATVFTGGAGLAGKIGSKVGEMEALQGTKLGKTLSDLGREDRIPIHDPKNPDAKTLYHKVTSRNPLTRAMQHHWAETVTKLEPHLPDWMNRYHVEHVKDLMGRHAAMNRIAQGTYQLTHDLSEQAKTDPKAVADAVGTFNQAGAAQLHAILAAGKALSHEDVRKVVQPELLSHNYWNLRMHAHLLPDGEELPAGFKYVQEMLDKGEVSKTKHALKQALMGRSKVQRKLLSKHGVDVSSADLQKEILDTKAAIKGHKANTAAHAAQLASVEQDLAKWDAKRASVADRAHSIDSIRSELDIQNENLRNMYDKGKTIAWRTKMDHPDPLDVVTNEAKPVDESVANIKRLEKQLTNAYAGRRVHDSAVSKINALSNKRDELLNAPKFDPKMGQEKLDLIHAHGKATREVQRLTDKLQKGEEINKNFFPYHPDNPIEREMEGFGKRYTTKDVAEAAKKTVNGKTHRLIVPEQDARNLGLEAGNSAKFLKWIYKYPTRYWKMATIGYSPKMVVDNAVGNWTMYAMRQMGDHGVRGVLDAIHQIHGQRTAERVASEGLKAHLNPHWAQKYFRNELGDSFFGSQVRPGNLGKKPSRLEGGLYPIVHKYADQPVRHAALNAYMRGHKLVRAEMKKGTEFNTAVEKVLAGGSGKDVMKGATEHIKKIAGDYHSISPLGQHIKEFVPFYMWDRHILKHGAGLLAEKPGRFAAMQALSQLNTDSMRKKFGNLPDWFLSDLPIGTGPDGRTRFVDTRGLNPYSSLGDLWNVASALTTGHGNEAAGEAINSTLNPLISQSLDAMSGHKLGTNVPVAQHGGIPSTALLNVINSIPGIKLARLGAFGTTPPKVDSKGVEKQTLYSKSPLEQLTNVLGFPVKDASIEAANKIQNTADKIKKGKKRNGDLPLIGGMGA